jgi:hypothetical protein
MKIKTLWLCVIVLGLATVASAQTKISGTLQCSKPDQQHAIEVGDRPNHAFVVSQRKCTWTKGFEIVGTEAKDHMATEFSEVSGNSAAFQGIAVGTMASGDKYFDRFRAKATVKDGLLESVEGTWSWTGGTGKLKGMKGKGTFKGKGEADGTATVEVEGECELPK